MELPPAPADWLLLVDRSTSWTTRFDRFEGMKDAVADFLGDRGTAYGIAATSFPRYDGDALDCEPTGYDDAELPWGTSAAMINAIAEAGSGDAGSSTGRRRGLLRAHLCTRRDRRRPHDHGRRGLSASAHGSRHPDCLCRPPRN